MKKSVCFVFLLLITLLTVGIQKVEAVPTPTVTTICNIGYTDGALYDNEWLFSISKMVDNDPSSPQKGYRYTIFFKNVVLQYCPASGCTNTDNSFSQGYAVMGNLNEKLGSVLDKLFAHPNFKNMYAEGGGPSGTLSNSALKQKFSVIENSMNPTCPINYAYIGSSASEQKIGFIFSNEKVPSSKQTFIDAGYSTRYELVGDDLNEVHKKNFEDHLTKMRENIQEFKDKNWVSNYDEECSSFGKFGAIAIGENLIIEYYETYKQKLLGTNYDFTEGDALLAEYKTYKCAKESSGNTPSPPLGEPVYGCRVIPDEIRDWIKSTLDLVKYVALVLVIVLGILDFIKAAASGEADQMKKSGSSFLKRIIAVVILFLLPLIVDLILNLIEIFGANSACLPE